MSSTQSKHASVDEDLQRLYNEVWAGFADEAPAASPKKQRVPAPVHITEQGTLSGGPTGSSSYAMPQPSYNQQQGYNHITGSSAVPPPAAQTPASPKSPNRRKLPPTPGGSASSVGSFQMPEPQPYHDPASPARSTAYGYDSHGHGAYSGGSNDLLKQAVITQSNVAGGRRLPQTPTSPRQNGSELPSTGPSRPYSPQSLHSPSSEGSGGRYTKPLPDPYYDSGTKSSPSSRPTGGSAPALSSPYPREQEMNDYQFSAYDDPTYTSNNYHAQSHGDPGLLSGSSSAKAVSRQPSVQTLNSSKYLTSAELPKINTGHDGYSYQDSYQPGQSSSTSTYYDSQPTASSSSTATSHNRPRANIHQDEGWGQEPESVDPNSLFRRPTDVLRTMAGFEESHPPPVDFQDDVIDDYWDDEEEQDPSMFLNLSLLSHIAVQLRDKVPRSTHVKSSIPYERAFTGKDIVSTIQSLVQRDLAINHGLSTNDRRVALQVARSLQSHLFFYEVEWGNNTLQDGVEDVYMFLDDLDGGSNAVPELEELPTGVVTMLTRCYSPSCGEGSVCYAFGCPRKGYFTLNALPPPVEEQSGAAKRNSWSASIDPVVLESLGQSEVTRQSIIHSLIVREEQYVQDLNLVESVFIKPLRYSGSTVISQQPVEDFIDEVFSNILDLRECNRRLLEVLYVRQREQAPIIQKIGDIFLEAATEFRLAYPAFIGHYPLAEKRLKEEQEKNPAFRMFLEQCSRDYAKSGEALRFDLKHFLGRPAEHLQKYPLLLEAILKETAEGNTDADFLKEAVTSIGSLQTIAQLRTFQSAMGRGPTSKWEWHDMVTEAYRKSLPKKEAKRQNIIFELIKGEMAYVRDLENIDLLFITPLRTAFPPIIAPDRIDQFIQDVFNNYDELLQHHRKLCEAFQEIQREQHPVINSITDAMMDAALNFREAYMDYIPNYPIAAYRIDDEMANNIAFKTFVEQCTKNPESHRLDMKSFVNRPIPRLLRYELLLKGIMEETQEGHDDHAMIPNVIDVIKALGKESEPGVTAAKEKVELWKYNANIVFHKPGEFVDMDLLDARRTLVHSGKLLRQPDSGLEWNWSDLFVLLFDNYLVMTKVKESKDKDGLAKYIVNRRPIPLDLLSLVNYTDPPTQRGTGLLRNLRAGGGNEGPGAGGHTPTPESASDARAVYPLTLHHNGRMGGTHILYAESEKIRTEWKEKLEHAIAIRKAVQESNKAFEVEILSAETFLVPLIANANQGPMWEQNNAFTGRVTCSVPFTTPDKRSLVAVGCQEGVWIGYRHNPNSLRRVLQLRAVTQCAMLEEFGIFLVLADKALFAYHIEALVPSSPHAAASNHVPQKLNGTKDVHFFSVGTLQGRTLVAYMKKKGLDSIFRVLEPVGDKINEKVKAPVGFGSRLGFRSTKSEWFRIYRDFFLPSESFDLIFLKARIAILCAKGFEIMDLANFASVTIPQRDDPKFAYLSKRCDSCRPLGMFRSCEDEFLLCYDEFGVYVDKHGDPVRGGVTIEWEGTAERVAFHPPHILLFDSRFIEVRNVETGRLAQIIPGKEIRCIWDGRGLSSSHSNQVVSDSEQQEAKVHAVMTNMITLDGQARTKAIAQQVFELVPTVPLYNPPPVNRRSMAQNQQQQQQQLEQQQYAYQQAQQQQQVVDLQPHGMNQHQQELYYAQQRQQLQRMQTGYTTNSDGASLNTTGNMSATSSGQTGYYAQQQHHPQHYPQHQQQQYQQHYGYSNSGGYTPSLTGPRSLEGHGAVPGPSDLGRNGSWRS